MKLIKVAAGVLNQTPLDWIQNREQIIEAIKTAKSQGVSILCLPELCVSGYGCEDAFHAPGVQETGLEILGSIVPHTKGIVVSVGVPVMYAGGLFNTAALICDGKLEGFVAKQHLAGDGIHYEPRWFKPWPNSINGHVEIDDVEYPIGDIIFDIGGVRVGFEVCEDAWVGSRPGARLAARGVDVILNPSASHFAFGKHKVRKRFVIEGSRAFNVTYVYANLLGNESGRAIFDGDAMVASDGKLLAVGKRLSFAAHCLTTAVVDIDATRMSRARTGSFEPEVDGDETDVFDVDFEFPNQGLEKTTPEPQPWEIDSDVKCEEFTRSVSLGLFDYMRKSRSRGFVVSLSGGADSAACVVLVGMMLRFAVNELDWEQALKRINPRLASALSNESDLNVLAGELLTTVYQSTRNSGDVTRTAAAAVAKAVGATHYEFDVDPLVQGYTKMVAEAIGTELNWKDHDISLQNIQARVRSPGVWFLANLNNALLLSTSNRSEAAVGYATMDGDTSGGLSPIAGIDKAFLREWLRWMETTGPKGIGPMEALSHINAQQPTAELRPPEDEQTDEDDLMPYEVLDQIERWAVRDKLMPCEVYEHLKLNYSDTPVQQLGAWIRRFFELWCRNQWKRERYAPGFHLDDANLDPKTWCRFPILSGGYQYELNKLDKLIESHVND